MSEKYYIGFDTSNYTTSIAILNNDGNVISNLKRLLPVQTGQLGLRQSDAVFNHIKSIPEMAKEIQNVLIGKGMGKINIAAIAYSGTPRSFEGSYMPCFLVGEALASCLASFLNVPVYKVSHQAGHVVAAVYSAFGMIDNSISEVISKQFAAFHVSGGTTDVLLVEPNIENVISITKIGGTIDVNAGQVIDRVGVRLGFDFPCGVYIDKAAVKWSGKTVRDKISVNGLLCNLSGLENKACAMIKDKAEAESVCAYTLDFISRTIERLTCNLFELYGNIPVIYAGGVMSSKFISNKLSKYGKFAEAQFSSDNAVGTAYLAKEIYKRTKYGLKE